MHKLAVGLIVGGALVALVESAGASDPMKVRAHSPDRSICVTFSVDDAGAPMYSITRDGVQLVRPSPLGFRFREAPPMVDGFAIADTSEESFDETWHPVWGKTSSARNHYNELEVDLREQEGAGRVMVVRFRVFDDGVGFRYELPEQPDLSDIEIAEELTQFRFAGDYTTWSIRADYDSYEHLWREMPLWDLSTANTPVTMRTGSGLYLSIHEANLTDYAGMTLAWVEGDPLALRCELVPWPDGVKVRGRTPLVSPWRTIQICDTPGGLVESTFILNLNEP